MNSSLKSIADHYDVTICGGGPVGLSMAYLLGRSGLSVALFERRPTTTTLPKGQYVHASTGELFRRWGVWDLLDEAGWTTEKSNGQGFYVNVANGPVARIRAIDGQHDDYVKKWETYSPVYPRKIPASDYESALRRQASSWRNTHLNFNSQVIDVDDGERDVRITVRDTETDLTRHITSRYLVACDGSHSFIRSRLGRGQDHGPTFANQVLVEFRADLDSTLGRDGFFHSFILNPRYAGWFGSQHPETGLWRYSFRHDEETPPVQEVILERIRGALGMPDVPIEVVQTYRFDYSTGLLRQWREGRIFFAGDTAHWHSPWGGFGMNSGVQDAANLAWKLEWVIKELAHESLLNTYEVERRSKALMTVKSATYNSLHYQAIAEAVRVGEGALMAQGKISSEAVTFLSQRVALHGDNSVLHTGYQLGTVYHSHAVVPNEETAPTPELCDYEETTVPGVRAPHAWLITPDGRRISTIDLWSSGFVLVGHRVQAHWHAVVDQVANSTGAGLHLVSVGDPGSHRPADDKFVRLYGKIAHSLALVRPDGFIAAKLRAIDEASALASLKQAMGMVLGYKKSSTADFVEHTSRNVSPDTSLH
jgi:2-polyprenyl-6-methoxyphenol hydroxylase-like FAD-dependent oxidoreductase